MKPALAIAVILFASAGCKKTKEARAPEAAPTTQPAVRSPHPPMPGAGELTYRAPAGWVSHPPSNPMRKAQFILPGKAKGTDAELVVFHFPGTGGNVADNLARWYGQFQQPDGSDSAKKAQSKKLQVSGLDVTVVYLTGTYLKPKSPMAMTGPTLMVPDQALLAAVVELPGGHWFFKAVGPRATIDAHRAAFDELVGTFRKKS